MKTVIRMFIVLTFIGLISGGLLSIISNWANPLIAVNKQKATENAIFLVHPEGKSYEKISVNEMELYKVFNQQKEKIGYAFVYEGNGFQGKVRIMTGILPDLSKITSIEILEQTETPGLGTKILESPFDDYFNGLNSAGSIGWVKEGTAPKDNEVVAITGATISSKAVVTIINEGLNKLKTEISGGSF
ncbi:MAG: FMN-binding protein [Ignavibacteria bacterium]|nr:FMN-binding protein [Ignavibacteria bacterium]